MPHDPGCHCLPWFGLHPQVCCVHILRGWTHMGPGLARRCGYCRALLQKRTIPAAFPRQRQTASSTLAAYRVSLYPDSSDRNLADSWALSLLPLCLGNQSCRKHSALLDPLWLNKACEESHYPNKLVEQTSEPA